VVLAKQVRFECFLIVSKLCGLIYEQHYYSGYCAQCQHDIEHTVSEDGTFRPQRVGYEDEQRRGGVVQQKHHSCETILTQCHERVLCQLLLFGFEDSRSDEQTQRHSKRQQQNDYTVVEAVYHFGTIAQPLILS
jgi:hypothetical protein